jgi:hypothetical protein
MYMYILRFLFRVYVLTLNVQRIRVRINSSKHENSEDNNDKNRMSYSEDVMYTLYVAIKFIS